MYSPEGQPLTITYLDYGKCSTAETPRVEVIHRPSPSPFTSLGQKAAGEGAAIPSPAAIASAVEDALKPFGVKVCDLQLTPELVRRLVNDNPETYRRFYCLNFKPPLPSPPSRLCRNCDGVGSKTDRSLVARLVSPLRSFPPVCCPVVISVEFSLTI